MSYALFKTNQSTKILVEITKSSVQPDKLFQHTQNVPLAGLLPKEITLVDANIGNLTGGINIYKPDIVINNNAITFTMFLNNNPGYVYLEVNCDINQLDKYYSLFLLIQNYKSIKSQLNLN